MRESGSDALDVEDGPFDWLGNPVSCADCPYDETRAAGRCDLGRICVMDRRARRIDRFFAANPAQAERHLAHPYFEVRALAARYASPFRLAALLDDPEPDVRATVALRLPLSRIGALARDREPRVRGALAQRLSGEALAALFDDEDCSVRLAAARRAEPPLLLRLIRDPDASVRREAARRAPVYALAGMIGDVDPLVRLEIAERLPAAGLTLLARDEDLRVRFVCAERLPIAALGPFAEDPDEVVRDVARQRLRGGRRVMGLGREQEIEIRGAPRFLPGVKVRATKHVKNDGTYPGREIGEILVRKGEVGYVRDVGTFLQQFYVYAVEWIDSGTLVGMRVSELAGLDEVTPATPGVKEVSA